MMNSSQSDQQSSPTCQDMVLRRLLQAKDDDEYMNTLPSVQQLPTSSSSSGYIARRADSTPAITATTTATFASSLSPSVSTKVADNNPFLKV